MFTPTNILLNIFVKWFTAMETKNVTADGMVLLALVLFPANTKNVTADGMVLLALVLFP